MRDLKRHISVCPDATKHVQVGYLDTVVEGVEVSRQDLGSGQYRWTITFLDEGDDFDLEVSDNELLASDESTLSIGDDQGQLEKVWLDVRGGRIWRRLSFENRIRRDRHMNPRIRARSYSFTVSSPAKGRYKVLGVAENPSNAHSTAAV